MPIFNHKSFTCQKEGNEKNHKSSSFFFLCFDKPVHQVTYLYFFWHVLGDLLNVKNHNNYNGFRALFYTCSFYIYALFFSVLFSWSCYFHWSVKYHPIVGNWECKILNFRLPVRRLTQCQTETFLMVLWFIPYCHFLSWNYWGFHNQYFFLGANP